MIGLDQTMGSPIRQEENHWNGNNRQGEYDGSIEDNGVTYKTRRKPLEW